MQSTLNSMTCEVWLYWVSELKREHCNWMWMLDAYLILFLGNRTKMFYFSVKGILWKGILFLRFRGVSFSAIISALWGGRLSEDCISRQQWSSWHRMELSSHFITNRKRLQIPLTGAQQGTLRWTAMSQGFKETFRASCTRATYQEKTVLMVVAVKALATASYLITVQKSLTLLPSLNQVLILFLFHW